MGIVGPTLRHGIFYGVQGGMISAIAGSLILAMSGATGAQLPSAAGRQIDPSPPRRDLGDQSVEFAIAPFPGPPIVQQIGAPPQFAQSIWKLFTAAEGKFSVLFPGAPQLLQRSVPYANGQVTDLRMFYVERSQEATAYMVTYNDFPFGHEISPDRLKPAFTNGRDRLVGRSKLLLDQDVALGPWPGREFKFIQPNGQVTRARMYYANGRLYQIMVATNREQDLTKSIDGFFNSFQILP